MSGERTKSPLNGDVGGTNHHQPSDRINKSQVMASVADDPYSTSDINNGCEMCRNYELQLQIVQKNEDELRDQLAKSQDVMKTLKDELRKEQNSKIELEEKFNEEAKNTDLMIQELNDRLTASTSQVTELKEIFQENKKKMDSHLKRIKSQKDELNRDVERLRSENNILLARNIAKSREMQSEIINLPQDLNEIHFYLLKLKEDFITTLVAKERNEETHSSERMFHESQSRSEIQNRDTSIETLTQENTAFRSQLELLKAAHEKQTQKLTDQEEILDQCQQKIASLIIKNDALSTDLRWRVDDLSSSKAKLEEEVNTLRSKVQSLQVELDNSEAVQRDFVKLSQTLQIQLEKIRQADSEVRWQHEDDIHECNSCNKRLNSRRDKTHCSHCGRIFCHDCNSKIIYGGPKNRPFKVCCVCHTLLDHETAPYFSSELPSGHHHN